MDLYGSYDCFKLVCKCISSLVNQLVILNNVFNIHILVLTLYYNLNPCFFYSLDFFPRILSFVCIVGILKLS